MKKKMQIGRKLLAALLAASLLNVAVLAAAEPAPEPEKEPVLQEEAVPSEKAEDLPEVEKEEEPAPEVDPEPEPVPEEPEVDPEPEPVPEEPEVTPEPEPDPEEPEVDPEPEPVPEEPEVTPEPEPVPEEPEVTPEPEPVPEEPEDAEIYGEADLIQAGSFTGPHSMPDEVSLFWTSAAENALYTGLKSKATSINVAAYNIPINDALSFYSKVVNDHPDLFYVHTGLSYTSSGSYVGTVRPCYHDGSVYNTNDGPIQSENLMNQTDAFEAAVNEALKQVSGVTNPVEKALILHDYLVVNCRYNWAVGKGQKADTMTVFSAYGALVKKDAVCQGYALAYKCLLDRAGVTAVTVSNSSHMWNQVQIGSNWYHVDTTHDDPFPNTEGSCRHAYFLLTDSTIRPTSSHGSWTSTGVTCNDAQYESGYIFNNDYSWPLYKFSGKFYYLKRFGSYNTHQIYTSTDLKGAGETISGQFTPAHRTFNGGNYYGAFSVVWKDGSLYYIGTDNKLHRHDLKTNEEALSAETLSIPASDFADKEAEQGGVYLDKVGLRYRDGRFQVLLTNNYDKIYQSFVQPEFPKYPSEWNSRTGILGVTADNKAGIRLATAGSATLYVATYSGGRMTGVRSYPVTLKENEVALVQLPSAPTARDKLMLVMNSRPACPAYPAA